jgi:hypothetical protein
VNTASVISNELAHDLIRKYARAFVNRFPHAKMDVQFTENGLPHLPLGKTQDAPEGTVGACKKAGYTYFIGIHIKLLPLARLSTFFHEYGHATYREVSNEDDSEGPKLVLSETAAMLSSLRLPDEEGLPEVAIVSATGILNSVNLRHEYRRQAFENISTNPLWLKYAPSTGTI